MSLNQHYMRQTVADEIYEDNMLQQYNTKTDAEIIHQLSLEFNSLNRIVSKKAANWQIAYRECIRTQYLLLTVFYNRKTQTNEG